MTSLRAVAANRATEAGRSTGVARPDERAPNASFPEALYSAANPEETSAHSKSRSDPKFETSSAAPRSDHSGALAPSAQRTDNAPPSDATQQPSFGDQNASPESLVAALTAGSAASDQFKQGSGPPSSGPGASAPSMPPAEIGVDDRRSHPIRHYGRETTAADAASAVAIIPATDAVPPPQLTAGSAMDGERNDSAAVSLPSSGIYLLGQPGGGPGWEIPRGSSAERASNIPFSPSQDGTPNDAAMIAAAHLAATSPATDTVDSVPTATSAFSPALASAAVGPGPGAPRHVSAIAASPATDAVDSAPSETSAFGPVSAASAIDPGPDAQRRAPAIAATTGTDPPDAALMKTSALAPASASSGSGAASDTPGQIPAIGASPEVIIAGPDRSAGHAREDGGSISSASLMAAAPNPVAENTGLTGSPVQGSAFLPPSDSQPVGLAEQLTHHVMTSIDNGGREVVLQLHPPELGELTVRILVSGRDVSAWFGSPQIPVQQALNQAIGRLQADLGSAGYNLDGAWVGADASGSRGWDARSLVPPRGAAARSSSDGSPAPLTPSAASGVSIYV